MFSSYLESKPVDERVPSLRNLCLAFICNTVLNLDKNGIFILPVAANRVAGSHFHLSAGPACLEQGQMEVGPVNHRIGIPESFPEVLIKGNVTNFFSRKCIHQTQTVDVNRVFPERSADSKEVETVEGIRGNLDPGSDFAGPFRLFQNQGMFPRHGQPKGRC